MLIIIILMAGKDKKKGGKNKEKEKERERMAEEEARKEAERQEAQQRSTWLFMQCMCSKSQASLTPTSTSWGPSARMVSLKPTSSSSQHSKSSSIRKKWNKRREKSRISPNPSRKSAEGASKKSNLISLGKSYLPKTVPKAEKNDVLQLHKRNLCHFVSVDDNSRLP